MVCINVKCMPLLSDLYRGYAIKSVFVCMYTRRVSRYIVDRTHTSLMTLYLVIMAVMTDDDANCHVHFHSLEVAQSLFARWREYAISRVR